MNLYLPVESDEEIEIEYNNNNYSLKERNGLFNIDTIIKNNNFFLVKRNGLILFKSTYNQIKYLEESIKVIVKYLHLEKDLLVQLAIHKKLLVNL